MSSCIEDVGKYQCHESIALILLPAALVIAVRAAHHAHARVEIHGENILKVTDYKKSFLETFPDPEVCTGW